MTDMNSLVEQTVALTRSRWTDGFVALYAYGGFVAQNMDDWSDLDVCLVRTPSDGALAAGRAWMSEVYNTFHHRVDPIGLSTDCIGEDAPWELSFLLRALRENARLLLGEDIRDSIRTPSERKLRLSVTKPALVWVRLLYSLDRSQPLPESLPIAPVSADREVPAGNIAWGIGNTVAQLLRAIIFLETGVFCEEKSDLRQELQRRGEERLADCAAEVMELRRAAPRFALLPSVPASLMRLAEVIPGLTSRLLEDLETLGLVDPAYEPDGKSLYLADGSRRDWASK